ncbi:lipopolysaccharide biosynthesis protein [Mongoliitalea daihaiensis]|uniref:lipopolysaccharide biosynthesis protein n=1 Tax=Mongoliitalea daihaiensis TaxID=2782006 RepID=UPI001F39ABE5|nr:polysaccharide biosynthesis C-terminal domain-containing protein [Mongoliitalea daihaiensis]UJP64417.1 oligosaccharide flippase family protein [Mongoliitalea daihaiensis]
MNSSKVSQSVWTTAFSYVGVLIGYFNLLWLMPYAMSPEQIGTFRTVQDMALLLVPFAQVGLGNGITKFFPQLHSRHFSFLTYSFFLTLMGFAVVAALFFLLNEPIVKAFSSNSAEILNFLPIVLIITLFAVLNSIADAFCRSYYKIAMPTFFREVLIRFLLGISFLLYLLDWINFAQVMWAMSIAYGITLLGTIAYMSSRKIFGLEFAFSEIPAELKKEFLSYSFISLLATTGALLIMKVDSLMVSSMIGLEANAIYTIGFSIAIVIEMPRRAVSQVAMPLVSDFFSRQEYPKISQLYKDLGVSQVFICLLIFIGIWANIHNIYAFVPNREVYEAGKWIVLIIGGAKILDVIFSINSEIILFSKYYVFNILATVVMAIAVVVFNLWLIPIYGIEGAALASFLALLIFNLVKYGYVAYKLKMHPWSWDLGKILVLGGLVFTIQHYLFLHETAGLQDLMIRSSTISISYLLGAYALKIAPDMQRQLWEKIKGLKP